MPVSVAPHATWLSALSLVPAVAVFLGTLQLSYRERRILSLVTIAVGMLGVLVGLSQVAQGPGSPLRFFEITNTTEAVGFFANRNHFAALLYAMTMLVAAWLVKTASEFGTRGRHDTPRVLLLAANIVLIVVLVVAQAISRSRAGLGLTIVALLAAFALAFSERGDASGRASTRFLVGALALAVTLTVQFALYRILERFALDPLADTRIALSGTTFAAAKAFMPLGSGMGTFVPVYAMFEKPETALINVFANRAHNDVLELLLEAGAPAALLGAVFLGWFVTRSVRLWRTSPRQSDEIDRLLARAASVIVVLTIAHSLVDYPLRTGAMMAVVALAFGLMSYPPSNADARDEEREARYPPHEAALPQQAPVRVSEPWGQDMNWPEEWRRRDTHRRRPTDPRD
jgi:O-antigen ligase